MRGGGRKETKKDTTYKGRLACIEQIHGTKRDPVRAIMEEFAGEQRNKTVDFIVRKSEEAVEGLFYVTNSTLKEARHHEN